MKSKLKVYVVGSATNYMDWIKDAELTENILNADLVMFTGGEDVHPSIYEEPIGAYTHSNIKRDLAESADYETAILNDKPLIGICRGAQFICAKAGGRLVQHQQNPQSIHPIITREGMELLITSSHHQAMFPYEMQKDEYKLIGWTEGMSKMHLNGLNKEISDTPFKEAEIVYFPKQNALGIQGHPEWMISGSFDKKSGKKYNDTIEYLNELVIKLINKTI